MFSGIISKPGTSRNNKTGTWRTGKKPKFLRAKCTACKLCYIICPEGCIDGKWDGEKLQKNSLNADLDYCKGCGNCAAVCPVKDIIMVKESE